MPIRTAPRFCLGGVVGLKSYCMVVDIRRDCMCRALGLFLTHKQCVVETGQMSCAETGQMSAVETGQMSTAETQFNIILERMAVKNVLDVFRSGLQAAP